MLLYYFVEKESFCFILRNVTNVKTDEGSGFWPVTGIVTHLLFEYFEVMFKNDFRPPRRLRHISTRYNYSKTR